MEKRIIAVFAALLLLASCDQTGKHTQDFQEIKIYQGTEGLVTEVVDASLPKEVYENENVDLVVKYTNKGPIEIANAKSIVAAEKGYLSFSDGSQVKSQQINTKGKENFEIIDDFMLVTYPLKAGKLEPMSEYHSAVMTVTTCYDYISKAFASVCIDTDPLNQKPGDKTCTAAPISLSAGQGGPLVISSIEPKMLLDGDVIKPQFIINVQNRGPGSVTRYGYVDKYCSNQLVAREDFNVIDSSRIEVKVSGIKQDIQCTPEQLALKGNADFISCTMTQGVPQTIDSYTTTISVELKYGYTTTTSREVKINKLPS
jgi:hypothetical protein